MTSSMVGAGVTIAVVMPVRTVMKNGTSVWGLTRVSNVPSSSPPRTLRAPTSVIRHVVGVAAGGLEVEDAEGDVGQRRPHVVEAAAGIPCSAGYAACWRTVANMCSTRKDAVDRQSTQAPTERPPRHRPW